MTAINVRRSVARDTHLRNLIAALQKCPLTRDEIMELFGLSKSSARLYMGDLGDLVTHTARVHMVQRTYQITGDQARIDAFLAKLSQPVALQQSKRIRSATAVALADPSRHIHLAAYDAPYRVPVCRARPAHTELHARFFGSAA